MATTNAALAREVKALKTELAELKKLHEESGGGKTLDQILKVAKKDMSKDKYEALIERYVAGYSSGKGFKGIVVSTWQKGWQGKAVIGFAGVGGTVTVGFVLEGLGAVTGWDGIRVVKKFSEWYASA